MVRWGVPRDSWTPLFVSLTVALLSACGGKASSSHGPSSEGPTGNGGSAGGGASASGGAVASGGAATGGAPSEIGYRCQGTERRIERSRVCDGVDDCPAGDDEPCSEPVPACPKQADVVASWIGAQSVCMVRKLGHSQGTDFSFVYLCSTGEAIQPSTVCNGIVDCPMGDDEKECPISCEVTCSTDGNVETCSGPPCTFPCADGSTILQDEICDGTATCPGGEDEECIDRFTCYRDPERSPLEFSKVCDGTKDCPDGEDEELCPPSPWFFICDDGNEILFPYFTAGCFKPPFPLEPHCSDGSAPYFPCPNPP